MTYYTIYRITNLINGKSYVGKHVTDDLDDDYMGSGKLLKRAIQKYGSVNFRKDILEILDTESKMNLAERILVVTDHEVSYNLCPGGQGGWGYINENGLQQTERAIATRRKNGVRTNLLLSKRHVEKLKTDPEYQREFSQSVKDGIKEKGNTWVGRKHSEETKQKMREAHRRRK